MTATAPPIQKTIRAYRDRDRDAVRDLVCRTAFRNRGHAAVLDDAELFADYWTRYYVEVEPGSCLVLEEDGEIHGCLLGCLDSRRFQRVMAKAVVPRVIARLVRASFRRERRDARSFLRWSITRGWREAPPVDLDRYPAHYHLNLLPGAYGERMYSRMALRFVEYAADRGVCGIHGQVLDRRDGGVWERLVRQFVRANPDVVFSESTRPSSLGSALLGEQEPMVNRAFGGSTADFARFLRWIGQWRHL